MLFEAPVLLTISKLRGLGVEQAGAAADPFFVLEKSESMVELTNQKKRNPKA